MNTVTPSVTVRITKQSLCNIVEMYQDTPSVESLLLEIVDHRYYVIYCSVV